MQPIGKVRFPSVGRCVYRSCCRSDLVEGAVSRIGLLCLGSGAGIGALGFRKPIILVRGVSALLCVWLSPRYLRPVLKDARGWCLRGVRFLRRASASAAAAARARRAIGRAFSAFVCGVTRVPPPLGVRCALFSVFVGVGRVSSALIKLTCFSVGLRLRAWRVRARKWGLVGLSPPRENALIIKYKLVSGATNEATTIVTRNLDHDKPPDD